MRAPRQLPVYPRRWAHAREWPRKPFGRPSRARAQDAAEGGKAPNAPVPLSFSCTGKVRPIVWHSRPLWAVFVHLGQQLPYLFDRHALAPDVRLIVLLVLQATCYDVRKFGIRAYRSFQPRQRSP